MENFPCGREQAQEFAVRNGIAWYVDRWDSGPKKILRVTKSTPLSEIGEVVVYATAWSKQEVASMLQELNSAYQLVSDQKSKLW